MADNVDRALELVASSTSAATYLHALEENGVPYRALYSIRPARNGPSQDRLVTTQVVVQGVLIATFKEEESAT